MLDCIGCACNLLKYKKEVGLLTISKSIINSFGYKEQDEF